MNKNRVSQYSRSLLFVLLNVALVPWVWGNSEGWVSTWLAPASSIRPSPDSESPQGRYQDQTLRLILHTSAGGSALRLKIANTHGNDMLKVEKVSVALQATDAAIVKGSDKKITFGGEDHFVLPRGGLAVSDPIEFKVPAMRNLSVSVYFKEQTPFITRHGNANQVSWLAQGDQVKSRELKNAKAITTWDFVSAVEVLPSEPVKVIAAVGDSITDGYLSTVGTNNRWPNYLARRLANGVQSQAFSVVNVGIGGNRVLRDSTTRFGENLFARLDRDVFSIPNLSHMVLLEGINDIGLGTRAVADMVKPEELIAAYKLLISRARAEGIKIIGATLLPYRGANYFTEEGEKTRIAVNQWIRNSGEFDGVIDFDQATQDPNMPSRMLPSFTEDKLHPNDLGYEAMANSIDLNLFIE